MKGIKKYSFIGKTSEEAMKKAADVCGEDSIYISSKIIENEEFGNMYEIVVGLEKEQEPISTKEINSISENKNKNESEIINKKEKHTRNLDMENEISVLKNKLEEVNSNMLNVNKFLLKNYENKIIPLPPEYINIENILQRTQISVELHKIILNNLIKKVPQNLRNISTLNDILYNLLLKMIKTKNINYSKITLFCGPTGVGKTTTIAKLAAKFKINNEKIKVGVISLDNYKVGAFKQLEAYSEVLELPLEIIDKPNQLIKAFYSLKDMDYIFIDTAGSSPYDMERIKKLDEFLKYHSKLNIEKVLVVPANIKFEDAKDAYINFNLIDVDSIVVTKMDETNIYGDIFSFLHYAQKPIRNYGIGQNVPDDFIGANNNFLIDLMLNKKRLSHKKNNKKEM